MLLDTCALLWLAQGGGQLSPDVLKRLAEAPFVYVSAISGFEVGIKPKSGNQKYTFNESVWI